MKHYVEILRPAHVNKVKRMDPVELQFFIPNHMLSLIFEFPFNRSLNNLCLKEMKNILWTDQLLF